jgi:hypothetical protein
MDNQDLLSAIQQLFPEESVASRPLTVLPPRHQYLTGYSFPKYPLSHYQLSVLNGDKGRPSVLNTSPTTQFLNAYRTATGRLTLSL